MAKKKMPAAFAANAARMKAGQKPKKGKAAAKPMKKGKKK